MSKTPVDSESAAVSGGIGYLPVQVVEENEARERRNNYMKLRVLAGSLLAGVLGMVSAQASPYCNNNGGVAAYAQPMVYPTPVVYTAPVVYNAPVYYAGAVPAYNQVVYAAPCPSPNVIIAGRGAYHTSWNTSPTVIHIGSNHAQYGMLPNRRCR